MKEVSKLKTDRFNLALSKASLSTLHKANLVDVCHTEESLAIHFQRIGVCKSLAQPGMLVVCRLVDKLRPSFCPSLEFNSCNPLRSYSDISTPKNVPHPQRYRGSQNS